MSNDRNIDPSVLGRELSALRKRYFGMCQECGAVIVGLAAKKWCSNRCAQRVCRRNRKQAALDKDLDKQSKGEGA